jgi:hypothetical protein
MTAAQQLTVANNQMIIGTALVEEEDGVPSERSLLAFVVNTVGLCISGLRRRWPIGWIFFPFFVLQLITGHIN